MRGETPLIHLKCTSMLTFNARLNFLFFLNTCTCSTVAYHCYFFFFCSFLYVIRSVALSSCTYTCVCMSVYVYVWYEPRVSHVHMRTGESFHDIFLISIFFWLLLFLFFNNRPFMSTKSCLYLEETRSFFVVYFQFLFFLLFVRFLLFSFFLSSRIMESFWCNHSAFCMLSVFSSDDRWRWSRWRGELACYGWFYDRSHGYWTRLTRFNFYNSFYFFFFFHFYTVEKFWSNHFGTWNW